MLTILAPAKLNLTLEVLAKRPDGFHEIRSIIPTINLMGQPSKLTSVFPCYQAYVEIAVMLPLSCVDLISSGNWGYHYRN